jgi:AraC-like DNA-binding protein
MMEFYLAERYGIAWPDRPVRLSPETAVVGPQSRPGLSIHLSGVVDVFTIHFQPTGLHRLFGWPIPSLVNEGVELADLLPRARCLRDAISSAGSFEERVAAAEWWLLGTSGASVPPSPVDHAARLLLRSGGGTRVADLAARSELSVRQFERRFTAAVGLPPKLYGRTARLARALAFKERRPELGWAEIALATGYADQAHLVRDCTALAGAPPKRFMSQSFNNVPPPPG